MTWVQRSTYISSFVGILTMASIGISYADRVENNSSLHDGEWNIIQIGNETTDANFSLPSLRFSADGAFNGKACNSFRGTYTTSEAGLTFGAAAATKMACPEPLMKQEHSLFQAFESVTSYIITDDGSLLLQDKNGATLITAR